MTKNVKLYYEGVPIYTYCRLNKLNYTRVYDRIHSKGYTVKSAIEEVAKLQDIELKTDSVKTVLVDNKNYVCKYKVIYNGQEMSIMGALKQFYKDNDIICTTTTITKGIDDEHSPQEVFDAYCIKVLKKYKRI